MGNRADYADPKILPQGAIIEFVPQGSYVKVSAIDPITLYEVAIVGDPSAGEDSMARLACRKLERIVARKRGLVVDARGTVKAANPRRTDPPSGWDF